MTLHFPPEEFAARRAAATSALQEQGLDAILLFAPESHYWLSGHRAARLSYEGNPLIMQENQVFFLHMVLMESETGHAMTPGHSVLVTKTGCERLSRHAPALVTCS